MARRGEQVAEHAAIGRVPAVADMQRPGRIGRHELEQHVLARVRGARAVGSPCIEDAADLGVVRLRREMEVDEPGACDLRARDGGIGGQRADDRLGERARVRARRLRVAHRDVARVVTVLGVAGALDLGRQPAGFLAQGVGGKPGERRAHESFDGRFQGGVQEGRAPGRAAKSTGSAPPGRRGEPQG